MSRGVTLNFTLFGRDATASRAIKKVGDESEKTHRRFGKLGGIGKAAGVALASGAAAAAAAVGAGAVIAVNAASDQQQAFGALDSVYKRQSGSMKAWASRQRDIGLSAAEAGNAAVLLGSQLKGAGLSAAQSAKQSQRLVGLGADLAATYGGSTSEAVESVSAAFRGEYDSMEKYGLQIKQSTVNQKALELGLWNGKGALDAHAQSLATQALLWEQTKDAQGQASRESDSYAGSMGRLRATITNATSDIGKGFLPAIAGVVGWVADKGIPAFRSMGEKVMPKVREMFASVKKTIDDNRPALEQLGRILVNVGKWVLTTVVPAFIKWEGIVLRGVTVALAGLGKVIPPLVSGFLRGLATIVGGFRGLVTVAMTAMGAILKAAEKGLGWLPGIGPKIKTASEGFAKFKDTTVSKLTAVETGLKNAADKVDAFGRKAKSIPEAKLKANITDLSDKLATAERKLKDPDLTKERRAEIKAEIAQLKDKVNEAKRKLGEVRSKTVVVRAEVRFAGGKGKIWNPNLGAYMPVFKMAQGGIVKGGRGGVLAWIGEAQHDEAVIPLPRGGVGAAGSGGDVHLHLDGTFIGIPTDQVWDAVARGLADYQRRRGYPISVGRP